jgi:hypothetical protein
LFVEDEPGDDSSGMVENSEQFRGSTDVVFGGSILVGHFAATSIVGLTVQVLADARNWSFASLEL